jgi:translocator protein
MLRSIVAFFASLIIAYIPGAVGNLVNASQWYDDLDKPPLNPPGWVFGVVWSCIYFATGVALYLIWQSSTANKTMAYILFGMQAVLNASWSLVFFGIEQPWFALMVIVALLTNILYSITYFRHISPWASRLFVPYAAWVAFATYLNFGIAWLN